MLEQLLLLIVEALEALITKDAEKLKAVQKKLKAIKKELGETSE